MARIDTALLVSQATGFGGRTNALSHDPAVLKAAKEARAHIVRAGNSTHALLRETGAAWQRSGRRRSAEPLAESDPDDAANAAGRVLATDARQNGGSPMIKARRPAGASPDPSTTASRDDFAAALDRVDVVFDSAESTDPPDDDFADDAGEAAPTPRTGNGDGPDSWVPPSVAGASTGWHAHWQWRMASDVRETMGKVFSRKVPTLGAKNVAEEVLDSTGGSNGKSGLFGNLRGHLFERWDVEDFNMRSKKYVLKLRDNPHNPGYDASRFTKDGKTFRGAVQHKSGAGGVGEAIEKMEKKKPGTACKGTARVPKDQYAAAKKAAGGRVHVEESGLSNKTIARRAKAGLRQLKNHGESATSLATQTVRAAGKGALAGVVVGAATDLPAFVRHDLNGQQFWGRRGVDAVEGGIAAAATATTVAGVTAGATLVASAATAGTLTATVAITVTASPAVVPAAGIAVAYGVSRAAGPVRRYVTDRLHSRAEDERQASGPDEPDECDPPATPRPPCPPTRPRSGPPGAGLKPVPEPAVA